MKRVVTMMSIALMLSVLSPALADPAGVQTDVVPNGIGALALVWVAIANLSIAGYAVFLNERYGARGF